MSLVFLWIAMSCAAEPAENLKCLAADPNMPAPSTLFYARLREEAYAALDRRQGVYEQVKNADQAREYQGRLRELMVRQLGGFPERTPLNPQVVGTVSGDGYRIEKVIFESQPAHHVTANVYVPEGKGPFPGVLVSSGHSRIAKAADYNQKVAILLARHGIAAMCYDPIGQGERSQILTPDGKPRHNGTTTEHFLVGVGSILVGTNTARYRVWDGIRAIDYLSSRPDIDPARVGFTGCSGGGTLTSYVMALDDRVACAAPACYLTTFRKLIETIGPQDAEQNIFGQLALGLDQADYVLLRAPRPTLISATTGDYFDIRGTWDNFRQAKRFYAQFGYPERIDLVEADGKHGVQPTNLAAIVRWMRRWLLGKDDAIPLEPLALRTEAELRCTERGQVLLLEGERSVFDLNAALDANLASHRKEVWDRAAKDNAAKEAALATVRQLTGVRKLSDLPPPKVQDIGRVQRKNYHIDKIVLTTDSGVPLPGLTYHPPHPVDDAYLYLHEGGKLADGGPGGPIEQLLNEGYVVVAVDLRGTGETAPSDKPDALLGDWKTYYLAYLLGKPLVGMHTEDALAAGHFVAWYKTKQPRKVHLVGVGKAGVAALHAAALAPELFASVTLRDTLESWSGIVGRNDVADVLMTTVHGALLHYDLPDLVRTLPAEKVRIVNSHGK